MNIQEDIDELISKYLSGEASPEEAIHLEDWKNRNEKNYLYFLQCEKIFSPAAHKVDTRNAWGKVSPAINPSAKTISLHPFSYFMRIAASLVLLIGLGAAVMYWFNNHSTQEIVYVTNAEAKQIMLSDGSDVTISPNSSLTAADDFGKKERILRLKGSASFSVVHNEKIPFVVDAGGVFIKDIGTRFFIRTSSDTDTVHVRVDEGVVLLFDDKDANVEIKAGGNALYVKSTKQIISNESLKAQQAIFNFSKSTLTEVLKKLNITYNTHIEIANPQLGNCTITTAFNNEKLETILTVLTETLGLTYTKTDKGYIIKGEQCNQ